jgi:hypothetical protein
MGAMMGARSPPLNPIEQNRIAEMYKTVIQMSSENVIKILPRYKSVLTVFYMQKLNEKNSWNFDLIDHMGKLIKDEGQGVNFQKVSFSFHSHSSLTIYNSGELYS